MSNKEEVETGNRQSKNLPDSYGAIYGCDGKLICNMEFYGVVISCNEETENIKFEYEEYELIKILENIRDLNWSFSTEKHDDYLHDITNFYNKSEFIGKNFVDKLWEVGKPIPKNQTSLNFLQGVMNLPLAIINNFDFIRVVDCPVEWQLVSTGNYSKVILTKVYDGNGDNFGYFANIIRLRDKRRYFLPPAQLLCGVSRYDEPIYLSSQPQSSIVISFGFYNSIASGVATSLTPLCFNSFESFKAWRPNKSIRNIVISIDNNLSDAELELVCAKIEELSNSGINITEMMLPSKEYLTIANQLSDNNLLGGSWEYFYPSFEKWQEIF